MSIVASIYNELKDLGITRIDYEGPEIAIYVKKPALALEKNETIRKIAKEIKKRIVIKADSSVRKDEKEVVEIIKNLVPQEAQVTEIKFDDELGEVLIKAKKPGLVIGKGGLIQQKIFAETYWRPV
ncbi:beta-CASP ribonuclease aCPSF1, partial [Sulfolobus sp. F3]